MGLRDIGASLPPGFRFYPSDQELVCHYLYKKITNQQILNHSLLEIDLHICEPWQLPEVAKLNANEWYFFSFRDRKYATGYRTNRATISGYWKATGKDRVVLDPMSEEVVGMRKTLVFYRNRAPNGIKTGWIMHEFRLETPHMPPKEDWVLCRVFHKSKEDNNSKLNTQEFIYETTPPSLTLMSSSPTNYQTIPIPYNRIDSFSSSMTTLHHLNPNQNNNSSIINNLLQYSPQANNKNNNNNNNNSTITQISSKCDDEYGFLWNMDLEENSLEDGVASNMDAIRFEVDNTNNNNNNNNNNNDNMVLL